MSCFTYMNCTMLRIALLLSVHSSVTISQKITLLLQRAAMNTRSIFSMPLKVQDGDGGVEMAQLDLMIKSKIAV